MIDDSGIYITIWLTWDDFQNISELLWGNAELGLLQGLFGPRTPPGIAPSERAGPVARGRGRANPSLVGFLEEFGHLHALRPEASAEITLHAASLPFVPLKRFPVFPFCIALHVFHQLSRKHMDYRRFRRPPARCMSNGAQHTAGAARIPEPKRLLRCR